MILNAKVNKFISRLKPAGSARNRTSEEALYNIILYKKTFKESLRYLFNVLILINTVFYLKLEFKLKIDQCKITFKNLQEIKKSRKIFQKTLATLFC